MEEFIPSEYQEEIFDFIKYGYGNVVVSAVAGSGKSKTIIECLKYIKREKKILFLAFNSSIVGELKGKINRPNTDIKTLHSLGLSILRYNFKDIDIKIDDNKYSKRLNLMLEYKGIPKDISTKQTKKYKENILKLCDLGRYYLTKNNNQLEDISLKHGMVLYSNEIEMVLELLAWSNGSLEETGTIDFGDMLYLPNILTVRTFKYDFIIIDEAQDLSIAQLSLFLKCFKQGGRFAAVGDQNQSIYGFAGSDTESFNKLKSIPNTIELPLSICYRCPEKVILYAQKIVPEIEKRSNAPLGNIIFDAKIEDVRDGDMILCRNTFPLVKLYLQLISSNTKSYIKGKDVGIKLISLINSIDQINLGQDLSVIGIFSELYLLVLDYIEQAKSILDIDENLIYENQEFNNLIDNIDSLYIISSGLSTKDELVQKIDSIFSDDSKEGICLSTIHKSKGLEAENVYILNSNLMPSKFAKLEWEKQQEVNLKYVAFTRCKNILGFIYDKYNMATSENKNMRDRIIEIKKFIEKLY